jgi:hypothetical protein
MLIRPAPLASKTPRVLDVRRLLRPLGTLAFTFIPNGNGMTSVIQFSLQAG